MATALGTPKTACDVIHDAVAKKNVCAKSEKPQALFSRASAFAFTVTSRAKNVVVGRYPTAYISSTSKHHDARGTSELRSRVSRLRKIKPKDTPRFFFFPFFLFFETDFRDFSA